MDFQVEVNDRYILVYKEHEDQNERKFGPERLDIINKSCDLDRNSYTFCDITPEEVTFPRPNDGQVVCSPIPESEETFKKICQYLLDN